MNKSEQEQIVAMFDRIAPTYDVANRILSLGLDRGWRKRAARALPNRESLAVLDIATGTADLLLYFCKICPNISRAVGVDMAEEMLLRAREKVSNSPFSKLVSLERADGASLPFKSASFDVVSIAFGIRNIVLKKQALSEMFRVLKSDGVALILEFSLPTNSLVRYFYLIYFRHILPLLGSLISRDNKAYRYLNCSVESFPMPQIFKDELLEVGFQSVKVEPLSLGIATLYSARKA
jgi:demethylmenaquinone methyltransferase/2-methoxy-6-polyprenyl-1,4-benzoquinol methylase